MVASPPLSPALPKYKLADYRYGREEMLALYVKDNKVCADNDQMMLVRGGLHPPHSVGHMIPQLSAAYQ